MKVWLIWLLTLLSLVILAMAIQVDKDSGVSESAVHIVYTERPEGEELEAYHARTLTSVLGSEKAAKDALIYTYKNAACGFSAKLTPEQVSELSTPVEQKPCALEQPGVLQVVPSRTYGLHSGPSIEKPM